MKRKKESIKLIVGTYRQSHHLRMTMGSLLAKPTSSRFKKKKFKLRNYVWSLFLGPTSSISQATTFGHQNYCHYNHVMERPLLTRK